MLSPPTCLLLDSRLLVSSVFGFLILNVCFIPTSMSVFLLNHLRVSCSHQSTDPSNKHLQEQRCPACHHNSHHSWDICHWYSTGEQCVRLVHVWVSPVLSFVSYVIYDHILYFVIFLNWGKFFHLLWFLWYGQFQYWYFYKMFSYFRFALLFSYN